MAKLHEWLFELLPLSPYSTDLGFSDCSQCANLKIMLVGKKYGSSGEVITGTEAYFERLDNSVYEKRIEILGIARMIISLSKDTMLMNKVQFSK